MISVSLLNKKIANGKLSLYLSYFPYIINPKTGKKTRREFIKKYIYETPQTKVEKKHNIETLKVADTILSQRKVQIFNKEYGFADNVKRIVEFKDFFRKVVDRRQNENKNYASFNSTYLHFNNFKDTPILTFEIDIQLIRDFRKFLLNTTHLRSKHKKISVNSASSYFKNFASVLKEASKAKLVDKELLDSIEFIKEEETFREYLTEEELVKLWNTDCDLPQIKHSAFFSVYTGLRYSDIENLKWENVIHDIHQGHYITLNTKKTNTKDNLPIPQQAYSLLKMEGTNSGQIFKDLNYSKIQSPLKKWIKDAGINKDITFHNFRHTYATLQLANGTEIYTVSKLLGHKNISTTQIYAKVIDSKKIESTNKINLNIDEL